MSKSIMQDLNSNMDRIQWVSEDETTQIHGDLNSNMDRIQFQEFSPNLSDKIHLNSNMDRIQSAVLQQSNSHASGVSFCLPYTYIIKNLSLFCFQAVKIPI